MGGAPAQVQQADSARIPGRLTPDCFFLCSFSTVQAYYGLLYSGFCAYSLYNPYWQYPDYVGWHNSPRGYYYKGSLFYNVIPEK